MAKEYLEDCPVEPGFRGPFNSGCDIVNNIVRSWIKGKIVVPVVYIEDRPSAEEYVGGIGNLNNAGNSNSTPQHTYNTSSNNQNVQGNDGSGQNAQKEKKISQKGDRDSRSYENKSSLLSDPIHQSCMQEGMAGILRWMKEELSKA